LRSFALSYAAVTFRIWLLLFPLFNLTFVQGYRIAAWIWIINAVAIEVYLWKIKGTVIQKSVS
ncbi:MAG: hypothetical protein R3345_15520, partial [Fulvivirga sp.]|nr:hypothetical protein [Fulvivirga sp.]